MLSTHLTTLLALTALSAASTIAKPKREASILRLPVNTVNTNCTTPGAKRQIGVPVANVQTGTRYFIDFSIGTPPQPVTVALDTGSSDTWVNPTCSAAGTTTDTALCNSLPVFKPGLSSTATDTGLHMDLAYGLGAAEGEYYTDNLGLGGASITNQQFGVASATTDLANGLMGVGPGIELIGYPNIIDSLASQGLTNSRAFSLDLRGVESASGSIIFGGIDTMKYIGALEKRPIIPAAESPDGADRYWIYMTSVGITKPGAAPKTYPPPSNPAGQAVFLDSGGTLSRLPTPIFNAILADFPSAKADPSGNGVYEVDCSVASQAGTVDFGFGNTIIHVPFKEFIWEAGSLCVLGVVAEDGAPVLGDSFLRAAYVVYDQDNKNLLLANVADCGTNLVAIGKGADAVPSVTGACGGPSTSSSSTSSSTPTTTPPSSTSSSTSSKPTISTSSSIHYTNATTYAVYPTSTLSTVYATTTYTISSCAPTVTNCPYGSVTTETKFLYTTYCPVEATYTPAPVTYAAESIVYKTTTYTISSCAASVKYCPYGSTTTQTYATYAHVSPTATGSVYAYATASSKAQEFTGGAGKIVGGFGALVAGALAGLALL